MLYCDRGALPAYELSKALINSGTTSLKDAMHLQHAAEAVFADVRVHPDANWSVIVLSDRQTSINEPPRVTPVRKIETTASHGNDFIDSRPNCCRRSIGRLSQASRMSRRSSCMVVPFSPPLARWPLLKPIEPSQAPLKLT